MGIALVLCAIAAAIFIYLRYLTAPPKEKGAQQFTNEADIKDLPPQMTTPTASFDNPIYGQTPQAKYEDGKVNFEHLGATESNA